LSILPALGRVASEVPGSHLAGALIKRFTRSYEAACLASSRADCRQGGTLEKGDGRRSRWNRKRSSGYRTRARVMQSAHDTLYPDPPVGGFLAACGRRSPTIPGYGQIRFWRWGTAQWG